MGYRNKLKYYLVHQFGYTNKDADKAIKSGGMMLNGEKITDNMLISGREEIRINDKILQYARPYRYILLYKPRGIETTFNVQIQDNLYSVSTDIMGLSYAGRLDKESEGLLLLSDDGEFIQQIIHPDFEKEKEYIVTVDSLISSGFLEQLEKGVDIGNYLTKPAHVTPIDERSFKIILTEGKNRQIRKMCQSLGYQVQRLVRTRIDRFELNDLKPGELKEINISK